MQTTQPPIGIIITQPAKFFEQYKEDKWLIKMQGLNTKEGSHWYRVMGKLPTQDFLYIYTVYAKDGISLVQFRTNYGGPIRNQDLKFPRPEGGVRTFKNANAIIHTGPFEKAPFEIPMQGFQGFKYVYEPLW